MHRIISPRLRHIIALLAIVSLGSGCATRPQKIADPPQVEVIRLKIAKVRNAIDETRQTISNSRGATYLPELYIRLAELLSEEARYHYQLAYEREQRTSRILHVPQVRLLKEKSIELYEIVLSRFPESPLAPRALFNIGHEHRELGNFDEMRKTYQKLVDTYKDNPLRYDALLVLGDNYFDANELEKSQTYYEQIASGDLTRVTGLGHYKLAWVWVNLGECKKALDQFELAISRTQRFEDIKVAAALQAAEQDADASAKNPSEVNGLTAKPNTDPLEGTQQDIDVRRESLVDLSYCYSRERSSKKALAYLRERSYNRATYAAALARLASRYSTMNKAEPTVELTRELLSLSPTDDERLDDARTFYAALKRFKRFERIDTDAKLITDMLIRYWSRADVTPEKRAELRDEFEIYLRDLATEAQTKMTAAKKESDRIELARALSGAYEIYVQTFPRSPFLDSMLLNYSDVLGVAQYDLKAGLRALEAASLVSEDKERQEALYDAIVFFQTSLKQEFDRSQYERVTARAALRRAADELLKFEIDKTKERNVKFAIAQTYYDEGRFAQAIDKLSAVAYEFPNSEEADAAIQLVLDSYNTINDNDGLMLASRRFMQESSPATPPLRGRIKEILSAAEQRKLDELSLKAAGDEGGDLSPLLEFAKTQKGTSLGERALINAFVAARAIGDTEKMYTLADELAKDYPKSEQLPGILTTLAQTAIARFEYDRAVTILRKAANSNPAQRVQLLTTTAQLQEQLGKENEAEAIFNEAIGAAQNPASRADALAGLAALLERRGDPNVLIAKLSAYADDGNPDALARLGLAKVATGKTEEAENYFQTVLNSDTAASGEAQARAHYGMAEVLLNTLRTYPDPEDVDLIQEFIAIVEVTQQTYLNAARQGSPEFTAAAFSRLAATLRISADKLESLKLPDSLGADGRQQVRAALEVRVKMMRGQADEALKACAAQLLGNNVFNPVIKQCLDGQAFQKTIVPIDRFKARANSSPPKGVEQLQQELSKNPEDIAGLAKLGELYLDAGDPHVARLIFARAIQLGGGPNEQNLLGLASFEVGDFNGAFSAFGAAARGGLEAGRQNLKAMLGKEGLSTQAAEVLKKYEKGQEGGRLLK